MLDGNFAHIQQSIKQSIKQWLEEDIGTGDVTSLATIPASHRSKGVIHAKEAGIICGLQVVALVFEAIDASLQYEALVSEGSEVSKGTTIAIVSGSSRSILMGERLALNLLQRLSGIATRTRQYVAALEGEPVRLVDTRKTTPGHRLLEKYAVRCGGGYNHRLGLYDAVMIKDNHIKAAGSIKKAVEAARDSIPHTMKIEVEVESLAEVEQALEAKADIIMLDNMSLAAMREAVGVITKASPHVIIEASGGINLNTISDIAKTGIHVISVGGLTSSVQSLDISLDLNEKKEEA